MSGGYSCTRDDLQWIVREQGDGSKLIEGVMFDDKQMDAYIKAGGLLRARDGSLSVAKGAN